MRVGRGVAAGRDRRRLCREIYPGCAVHFVILTSVPTPITTRKDSYTVVEVGLDTLVISLCG
jgi:hypothetical protein